MFQAEKEFWGFFKQKLLLFSSYCCTQHNKISGGHLCNCSVVGAISRLSWGRVGQDRNTSLCVKTSLPAAIREWTVHLRVMQFVRSFQSRRTVLGVLIHALASAEFRASQGCGNAICPRGKLMPFGAA